MIFKWVDLIVDNMLLCNHSCQPASRCPVFTPSVLAKQGKKERAILLPILTPQGDPSSQSVLRDPFRFQTTYLTTVMISLGLPRETK